MQTPTLLIEVGNVGFFSAPGFMGMIDYYWGSLSNGSLRGPFRSIIAASIDYEEYSKVLHLEMKLPENVIRVDFKRKQRF
jgi:hypothetical protein